MRVVLAFVANSEPLSTDLNSKQRHLARLSKQAVQTLDQAYDAFIGLLYKTSNLKLQSLMSPWSLDTRSPEMSRAMVTATTHEGSEALKCVNRYEFSSIEPLFLTDSNGVVALFSEISEDLREILRNKSRSLYQTLQALEHLPEELIVPDAGTELAHLYHRIPLDIKTAQPVLFAKLAFLAQAIDCVDVPRVPRLGPLLLKEIPSHISHCLNTLVHEHQLRGQMIDQNMFPIQEVLLSDIIRTLQDLLQQQGQGQQGQQGQQEPTPPRELAQGIIDVMKPQLERLSTLFQNQASDIEYLSFLASHDITFHETAHALLITLRSPNTQFNSFEQRALSDCLSQLSSIAQTSREGLLHLSRHVSQGVAMNVVTNRVIESKQRTTDLLEAIVQPLPWSQGQREAQTQVPINPDKGFSLSVGLHCTHKEYTIALDVVSLLKPSSNVKFDIGLLLRLDTAFFNRSSLQGAGFHAGVRTSNWPVNLRSEAGVTQGQLFLSQSVSVPFTSKFSSDVTMDCELTFGFLNNNVSNPLDFIPLVRLNDINTQIYGGIVVNPIKTESMTAEASLLFPINQKMPLPVSKQKKIDRIDWNYSQPTRFSF